MGLFTNTRSKGARILLCCCSPQPGALWGMGDRGGVGAVSKLRSHWGTGELWGMGDRGGAGAVSKLRSHSIGGRGSLYGGWAI